jgi:hypothetical protein
MEGRRVEMRSDGVCLRRKGRAWRWKVMKNWK